MTNEAKMTISVSDRKKSTLGKGENAQLIIKQVKHSITGMYFSSPIILEWWRLPRNLAVYCLFVSIYLLSLPVACLSNTP